MQLSNLELLEGPSNFSTTSAFEPKNRNKWECIGLH